MPIHLKRFDNKHKGCRGFIIGGGPSIINIKKSGFNFDILQKEITVGVNKAYNLFTPTYLIWTDAYFWKAFRSELIKLRSIKFCPIKIVRKFSINKKDIYSLKRDKDSKKSTYVSSLSNSVPMWNNSGVTALRIAYILGLNPIYLIGIDLIIKDLKGRTHFHKAYNKNRVAKTTFKRYNKFFESFKKTIKDLEDIGVKIYSCSKVSRLNELIEYKKIDDLFN